MSERYTKEMYEEYRSKQDEAEAKKQEEQRERVEKESARQAWIRDGGRSEDFEREWPKIRDEARRQRVADADKRARETMRASRVSSI
jgi:hypothetical protein